MLNIPSHYKGKQEKTQGLHSFRRFDADEPQAGKAFFGKRLQFLFPSGEHQARCYLPKSVLKELRMNFKLDIKLHPKQHRKQ